MNLFSVDSIKFWKLNCSWNRWSYRFLRRDLCQRYIHHIFLAINWWLSQFISAFYLSRTIFILFIFQKHTASLFLKNEKSVFHFFVDVKVFVFELFSTIFQVLFKMAHIFLVFDFTILYLFTFLLNCLIHQRFITLRFRIGRISFKPWILTYR